MCPNLRVVDLQCGRGSGALPVSTVQLQHMCFCCPALESLDFGLCKSAPLMALLPLLQLSALTRLGLHKVGDSVSTVAAFAARLTGLKQLSLTGLPQLKRPALDQLTALTGLQELHLHAPTTAAAAGTAVVQHSRVIWPDLYVHSKVRAGHPIPP